MLRPFRVCKRIGAHKKPELFVVPECAAIEGTQKSRVGIRIEKSIFLHGTGKCDAAQLLHMPAAQRLGSE